MTERGVKNRTATFKSSTLVRPRMETGRGAAQYAISHFVEFYPHYDGPRPDGMKGMVESNYGKGNTVYKERPAPGDYSHCGIGKFGIEFIWAVSHVDSAHWCFLPPNFNESGAASMMGANAWLKHYAPTSQ